MNNIDDHLKSCSEKNDVYVYSFNKSEVDEINKALHKKSWLEEVRELIKGDEECQF